MLIDALVLVLLRGGVPCLLPVQDKNEQRPQCLCLPRGEVRVQPRIGGALILPSAQWPPLADAHLPLPLVHSGHLRCLRHHRLRIPSEKPTFFYWQSAQLHHCYGLRQWFLPIMTCEQRTIQ